MDQAGARGAPHARAQADPANLVDLLVASATDYAIYALDADGRVVTWNEGARRVKGWEADEVLGRHVSVFYLPEDIEAGKPDRDLAIATADGHLEEEGWRIRKDGTRFWANAVLTALRGPDGQLVGFGKVTRDLTERKRGEDALRESEERFRLLVSSVGDYAIFLLDTDGRVASWNLGAERLKGYRPDEIIGRPLATFYTEEDRRAGVPVQGLEHARTTGVWRSEGWRVRKDGSRFWASVVITALHGNDGGLRGFAKVTRDLTDRKRSEDALRGILERERATAAQLEELDRIRSDLVSTVAHDLRAPVGVVQALLHLLLDDWASSSDAEKHDMVERMAERVRTLSDLVDDVFELVSIEAGHLEVLAGPIDVAAIVEAVADDARTERPTANIDVDVQPGTWAVGDERRTWQVLSNLVSNAVKFSPPSSPVRITVGRVGDEVAVAVVDQGKGIAPDQQDAIFQRFTRLPEAAEVPGSGLGLFIARSLAEAQGGRISVESEPGAGSTFRLTLPVDAERSAVGA
jgi:PAS domain S-box-containing protein